MAGAVAMHVISRLLEVSR